MEKDNFISKPTKEKEKFKPCLVGIQKQSVNIKNLHCLHWVFNSLWGTHELTHFFPILVCPSMIFLAKLGTFANLLGSFDK